MTAATHTDRPDFHLIHPDHYAAHGYPHDVWKRLRREDPVHWFDRTQGRPFWAITKHADIVTIGKRPDLFLNGPRLVLSHEPELPNVFPPTLIQLDPPKHGLYRQMISKRFTPRYLQRMHGDIERIGKQIVDELLDKSGSDRYGECDFVSEVSAPLPIAVIAWMLGVPESDWRLLFDWTNRTIGAGDPEYREAGKTPQETAMAAMTETFAYFAKLIEEKRKKPADDLVTLFANLKIDGQPLPEIDVLTFCLIIVIAGNETTRNGTTGGMLAFIEHQDQMRKLQRDPSLLESAVEEVVRWTSPIIHFARTATQDFPLRDKVIKEGDGMALFYPSANRDEEIFPDGDVFRIDRKPNHHLGFGVGEHFCLGSHVARLELAIAYKHLLPRIEEIEISGEVVRLASSLVGGVKRLPIRYKLKPA
ncbi:MAG: cytochrome P450 [Myxococcota bacterium]|jgi:cytochrome P450|nr:cytochrome P450 [Myxococcota bacterium]